MKKTLLSAIIALMMLTSIESKAQLANGNLAPDFTFTDIAGHTQHLFSILDSGYTVYLDVSAAWCGPCWNFHTGVNYGTAGIPALEGLYANYGPNGTNEVRVLYIEGELTNTITQLQGPAAGGSYATATQGDWITNTLYPIIDLSSTTSGASSFLSTYQIHYFPTVYMICPDRAIREVGQNTEATLYADKSLCAIATVSDDAELLDATLSNLTLQACDSVIPTFKMANVGTTTLTSATLTYKVDGVVQKIKNWTGSLNTYSNVSVTGVKLGSSSLGVHAISVAVSNPNGGTDPTISNNSAAASFLQFSTVGGPLVIEDFETSGIPSNWTIANGGASPTWANSLVGAGTSTRSLKLGWYNIPDGDIDIFYLPPISFQFMTSPVLNFDIAYAQNDVTKTDNLRVEVSSNCGQTWTPRYNRGGGTLATTTATAASFTPTAATQWRTETATLNAYAGLQDVLIRFKGTCSAAGNNLYVDNINVSATSGIEENNTFENVIISPNPATENTTVKVNLAKTEIVVITMYDAIGKLISSENLGSVSQGNHSYTLNTGGIAGGLYFLNVKIGNQNITKKVIVNK